MKIDFRRQMSEDAPLPGVPYLVHFPDGRTEVHEVRLPYVASRGTMVLPGWVVERVAAVEGAHQGDGDDVAYEVWVAADSRHDSAGAARR